MSDNLDHYLLFFRSKLARLDEVTFGEVERVIDENRALRAEFSEDELEQIRKRLWQGFRIVQSTGSSVHSEDYEPWLAAAKSGIEFHYWSRLRDYLLVRDILPPNVISRLDTVTDEILDYSGNPAVPGGWSRRGMVMGHVQSGKTTNYSALICKAADAGYKIIILLAGLTNSLRSQTQERIDETFIGKKSVFQSAVDETMTILTFSEEKRFPAYGTSRDKDFHKSIAANYGVSLSSLSEPIIFVTKKNKSVLENLKDWIKDQNHGAKVTEPLLLIDDEADNASVNTSKDPSRSTAINHAIRDILQTFERSTYIGYTATPFANIFIDPNSNDEMIGDELFPRDFIKSLDPPSNYVGATKVFLEDGELRDTMIRLVDDYRDILPLRHKIDLQLLELPPSLFQAVRIFVISRALRCLRGDGNAHCTMMINVSRFNVIQSHVEGLVYKYLQDLKSAIAVNARAKKPKSDPLIALLCQDFEEEFGDLEFSLGDVLHQLHDTISTIGVVTINMRGGSLDYEKNKKEGLHVIVIGGLALSRGLTLEGLTVSYILRNASASDTLMQMARWFGYRPNYDDLCRLYLPESAADHYEQITEAIEELRAEVNVMEQLHQTPRDFGLKVRQSPTGINITAANKMRSASELLLAQDFSGRHIEGHALFSDKPTNESHFERLREFFSGFGDPNTRQVPAYPFWARTDGRDVARLISEFKFPEIVGPLAKIVGNVSLVDDYISDRVNDELSEWDVAVPGIMREGGLTLADVVPNHELKLRSRLSGKIENGVFRVNGSKNRVADPDDAQIGLDTELVEEAERNAHQLKGDRKYCAVRKRPLLLVHIFDTGASGTFKAGRIAASISICFPTTAIPFRERTYQVNKVYRQSLKDFTEQETDDDERLMGEDID